MVSWDWKKPGRIPIAVYIPAAPGGRKTRAAERLAVSEAAMTGR
jgi:hypothetical protein